MLSVTHHSALKEHVMDIENLLYPVERNIAGKRSIEAKLTSISLLSGKKTQRSVGL